MPTHTCVRTETSILHRAKPGLAPQSASPSSPQKAPKKCGCHTEPILSTKQRTYKIRRSRLGLPRTQITPPVKPISGSVGANSTPFFGLTMRPLPSTPPSRSHHHPARLEALQRQPFVLRFAAISALALACAAIPAPAADPDPTQAINLTLKSIEARYNRAQSLKLDFSESYSASKRLSQTESGVLYLHKPGRMRWEYSSPAGKIFLADGKETWLYTPENHRAERASLKLSEDDRAPLAFLLGKLDFHKEFQSFEQHSEDSGLWITAKPKSSTLSYAQIDFLADPEGRILKLRVTNQDQSRIEYAFSNEQLNAPVTPGLFVFRAPPGVEIITAEAQR